MGMVFPKNHVITIQRDLAHRKIGIFPKQAPNRLLAHLRGGPTKKDQKVVLRKVVLA